MNILKRIKNKILSSREATFEKQMRAAYKDKLNAPLDHEWQSVHFNYADKKAIYICHACHLQYVINPHNMFDKDSHIALLNDTTAPCKPKNAKDYAEHDIGGEG